jgi:hypothetical protein
MKLMRSTLERFGMAATWTFFASLLGYYTVGVLDQGSTVGVVFWGVPMLALYFSRRSQSVVSQS